MQEMSQALKSRKYFPHLSILSQALCLGPVPGEMPFSTLRYSWQVNKQYSGFLPWRLIGRLQGSLLPIAGALNTDCKVREASRIPISAVTQAKKGALQADRCLPHKDTRKWNGMTSPKIVTRKKKKRSLLTIPCLKWGTALSFVFQAPSAVLGTESGHEKCQPLAFPFLYLICIFEVIVMGSPLSVYFFNFCTI